VSGVGDALDFRFLESYLGPMRFRYQYGSGVHAEFEKFPELVSLIIVPSLFSFFFSPLAPIHVTELVYDDVLSLVVQSVVAQVEPPSRYIYLYHASLPYDRIV